MNRWPLLRCERSPNEKTIEITGRYLTTVKHNLNGWLNGGKLDFGGRELFWVGGPLAIGLLKAVGSGKTPFLCPFFANNRLH
ncbi:MAG: hypothetical protein ACK6DS_06555 [Planctomycetota bacterium]